MHCTNPAVSKLFFIGKRHVMKYLLKTSQKYIDNFANQFMCPKGLKQRQLRLLVLYDQLDIRTLTEKYVPKGILLTLNYQMATGIYQSFYPFIWKWQLSGIRSQGNGNNILIKERLHTYQSIIFVTKTSMHRMHACVYVYVNVSKSALFST